MSGPVEFQQGVDDYCLSFKANDCLIFAGKPTQMECSRASRDRVPPFKRVGLVARLGFTNATQRKVFRVYMYLRFEPAAA